MTDFFVNVTEMEGQRISAEQLDRICHRYHWAALHASGKDVLEVACGAGQGLGLLRTVARSLHAGDVSDEVLAQARRTFPGMATLQRFGAEELPYADDSFDVVLLFEAIYYVINISAFLAEARRVLRPGGKLLIATANKDLYDFNPSPFSNIYPGVCELGEMLADHCFSTKFWGYIDVSSISPRQRILRPVKFLASKLNLIPKTMAGKEILKRIVFGRMAVMPASIDTVDFAYIPPEPLSAGRPARHHKVIYCAAVLNSEKPS